MRKFDCNSFRITGNTNFKKKLTSFVSKSVWGNPAMNRGGSRWRVQGVRTPSPPPPPPEMTCGFLITLIFCKKKKPMWFIGVEVEQETSAPPPKKILDPPLMKVKVETEIRRHATGAEAVVFRPFFERLL